MTIDVDHVRIGNRIYNPVRMGDVFEMLARSVRKNFGYSAPRPQAHDETRRQAERPDHRGGTVSPLSRLFQADGSDRPRKRQLEFRDFSAPTSRRRGDAECNLWGSIGWATGATLGVALADPSRRTILFTGEGSHQLTATAVGTMGRYGLKPIIFVLNNEGYMVERASRRIRTGSTTTSPPGTITPCPPPWAARVGSRPKSLRLVSSTPHWPGLPRLESACYIEVVGGRTDYPAGLAAAHQRLDALYGDG